MQRELPEVTYDPSVPTKPIEGADLTIGNWLYGHPTDFLHSPAFVAIIAELLDILHNPHLPKQTRTSPYAGQPAS